MRFFPQKKTRLPAIVERTNTTLPEDATDDLVIAMWLEQRPETTQEAYRQDIYELQRFTGPISLKQLNLLHLQQFARSMEALADSTKARRLSAVKSLLTFCHKSGYTIVNVGAALRLPKVEEKLAGRIMSEASMQKILALETDARNHALLRLLYNAGGRVSEIVALTWEDVKDNPKGGQIRVYGKGEKERYILISAETYQELMALKGDASDFSPVFASRKKANGGFLDRSQVNRIVQEAAIRAGIALYQEENNKGEMITKSRVSPHWFRHAHGSHALDKGAPITLVRDTLGHKSVATTNKYAHARPDASSGNYLSI